MNKVKYFQKGGVSIADLNNANLKDIKLKKAQILNNLQNNDFLTEKDNSNLKSVEYDQLNRTGYMVPDFNRNLQNDFKNYKTTELKNNSNYPISYKKYQQGGQVSQEDPQQKIMQLVQLAMSGDQKATEIIQQIMQAAKKGDQQALQLAQMIQQISQQLQGQTQVAKMGSKLQYIKSLKSAKGDKTCTDCEKKIQRKS